MRVRFSGNWRAQSGLQKNHSALEGVAPVLKRASLSKQVDTQIHQFTDQFAERNLGKLTCNC